MVAMLLETLLIVLLAVLVAILHKAEFNNGEHKIMIVRALRDLLILLNLELILLHLVVWVKVAELMVDLEDHLLAVRLLSG